MSVDGTRRQTVAAWSWSRIRELQPSERIVRLQGHFAGRYAERGNRIYTEDEPMAALAEAIRAAYRATSAEPAILRRARVLTQFADRAVLTPHADDSLLGLQTCNRPWPFISAEERAELGYDTTTGHIVHDYQAVLDCGTSGLRERIAAARDGASADAATNLEAFEETIRALTTYIRRHARAAREMTQLLDGAEAQRWAQMTADCERLVEGTPDSFAQALQLVWFAHVFLHAENPSVAISFGRIDQYLWPYLQRDIAAGRGDPQAPFDLLCAFLLKCCEGEESQNALLGGVTESAEDAANPLSLLMLAAMKEMKTFQPSLSVRLHPLASDDFVQAACELAACGLGQPGFMNDGVVTEAMQAAGIPPEDAWNWGVVGCYEATVQGACYPNTVLGHLHLVQALAEYMDTATAQNATQFDEFMHGWWEHLRGVYKHELAVAQEQWDRMAEHAPSPFGSVLMRGCIQRATPLEQGGADYNLVGFAILGLGTLTDGFHALRELVYAREELTVRELAAAMAADYPDEALRMKLRNLPHRYGTDSAATNALSRQFSEQIARMVLDSTMAHDVRPYPGFYWFAGDIYNVDVPSPDGRRAGDLISFGCGPSSAIAATPTEVMSSSSHVAHRLAACGNPLAITLQPSDVQGERGAALIRHLVESYFALGGFHVHFNVADPEMLRQAQADPENHANLTVRVSGYSARFVTVERQWQDALIERAEKGM